MAKPTTNATGTTGRKRKKKGDPSPPPQGANGAPVGALAGIFSAADWEDEPIQWLAHPWVAKGCLTLLAGRAGTGKSTFGAWLMAQAKRAAMLPGMEEGGGMMTRGRLLRHGVNLANVAVLRDQPYVFPRDKERVLNIVREWRANLLWLDPIQSYMGGESPNDGAFVRPYLESLHWIAEESKVAVVGVMHPGKQEGNLLPGAHEWRDVPRTVLEFIMDKGPPEKRLIMADKDNLGAEPPPTWYDLAGKRNEPKLWTWGKVVPDNVVDELRSVRDMIEKAKIDEAEEFLKAVLKDGEQESSWIYKTGLAESFNDRILRRAASRLGVKIERRGTGRDHKSYWTLPG